MMNPSRRCFRSHGNRQASWKRIRARKNIALAIAQILLTIGCNFLVPSPVESFSLLSNSYAGRPGYPHQSTKHTRFAPCSASLDNRGSEEAIRVNPTSANGDNISHDSSIGPRDCLRPAYYKQSTITPYHILHPLAPDQALEAPVAPRPLFHVLKLIEEALLKMTNLAVDDNGLTEFVRIEHPVTADSVDPLAWISAQQELLSIQSTQSISESFFYCQNQEEDFEVAAIGATHTCNETLEVWSIMERPDWPQSSRFYGGERYDSGEQLGQNNPVSPEWKAYGNQAWWFLPKLELRRESRSSSSSSSSSDLVLAIHVNAKHLQSTMKLVQRVTDQCMPRRPPTTLPPLLSRSTQYESETKNGEAISIDGQNLYEMAVSQAIEEMEDDDKLDDERLKKVVLCRVQKMELGVSDWCALAVLRRWKYGGHEGGHLFWMQPGDAPEFFGCAPERLFRIKGGLVQSEALAGTRPRGSTPQEDSRFLQELLDSPKDKRENLITGQCIQQSFESMREKGWIDRIQTNQSLSNPGGPPDEKDQPVFFVRRLLHLQHLCQSFKAHLLNSNQVLNVSRHLLRSLHPTPAVCGAPLGVAQEFIRKYESIGFDRGFYSGPVGYLGKDASDMFVALRSALLTRDPKRRDGHSSLYVYAGAGVVPGSTVKGEWAETNYKLAVISSVFPQSPMTLQGSQTPNVAWAAAFVEELLRNGVTHFYVSPGSRSTPLVVALSRAARSHVGVIHIYSVHDERAAAFRALGYARGTNRPAAVVTSSGTAVANLYPAVVEASMDGVPLLLLTADRPYENRDTGANQAIDQVKIFSGSYIRWFRDILPPSDEVPISLVLSDACHAVDVAHKLRGPVHLNIQFRENLAPEGGAIRNDDRRDSLMKFNAMHFTETAKFRRWSMSGQPFSRIFSSNVLSGDNQSLLELAQLISRSKRGLIVVGNVRSSSSTNDGASPIAVADAISSFAQEVGFPIIAGAQQIPLRFRSTSVILFAEHILKSPEISKNLNPDLVIQIGSPLISTEVPSIISKSIESSVHETSHVLIHPHTPQERIDPGFTVTHNFQADHTILKKLLRVLPTHGVRGSELAPLVKLGKYVQKKMKGIIRASSSEIGNSNNRSRLSEPEVILALAESFSKADAPNQGLFLSNSMPIRDAEFFLYPMDSYKTHAEGSIKHVGSNRGASGIDGIFSSALGFSEAIESPTTLLIGDVSALHDLGSLHNFAHNAKSSKGQGRRHSPLTSVVINNDGGGIFSFLPIAQHSDVGFDELFGTPTNSFSFSKGAEAFGMPYSSVKSYRALREVFCSSPKKGNSSLIEAVVMDRSFNVKIHKKITQEVSSFIDSLLISDSDVSNTWDHARVKTYSNDFQNASEIGIAKTAVLLHGWMGDKNDWDEAGLVLADLLPSNWQIKAVDLAGHSALPDSDVASIREALNISSSNKWNDLTVRGMAKGVEEILVAQGVSRIDGIVGYSLGGRVALAMRDELGNCNLIHNNTKLVLLSSFTEHERSCADMSESDIERMRKDDNLAKNIRSQWYRGCLLDDSSSQAELFWDNFLDQWYSSLIWGNLQSSSKYREMKKLRAQSLADCGPYLAKSLSCCSPPRNRRRDEPFVSLQPSRILMIAGEQDQKYCSLGSDWSKRYEVEFDTVPQAGHSLLVECPVLVAERIAEFLCRKETPSTKSENMMRMNQAEQMMPDQDPALLSQDSPTKKISPSLKYRSFSIDMLDSSGKGKGIAGVGWGDAAKSSSCLESRKGLIVQIGSKQVGSDEFGLGEISPLKGLHSESLDDAFEQVKEMEVVLSMKDLLGTFNPTEVLKLNGFLSQWIEQNFGDIDLLPSVRSGVEMALLGFAANQMRLPVYQALLRESSLLTTRKSHALMLNGLMPRGSGSSSSETRLYASLKVKVGHQDAEEDFLNIQSALSRMSTAKSVISRAKIRLDANRAWNMTKASSFSDVIRGLNCINDIEFIEEPLAKSTPWSLESQVEVLESWSSETKVPYALDESLADLVQSCSNDFSRIQGALEHVFARGNRGCVAFVLKPALLGLETSMQIARLARQKLNMSAVFSSSFDSGVGLAYTAFIAAAADSIQAETEIYPHGLGTFSQFNGDVIIPTFGTYVNGKGELNVASISRAMFGLTLDELDLQEEGESDLIQDPLYIKNDDRDDDANVIAETELSTTVSIPLPFSAETAHNRFTDLPQQPRWSPWLSSVAYQGRESEWKINIRGISLKWRATSELLYEPWLGIRWESVSGVSNRGKVEFIPSSNDAESCQMKVHITIVPPRILSRLFQFNTSTMSSYLEDFIRDKILNWSLEMFRDVVLGDLAIERGEMEVGDAMNDSDGLFESDREDSRYSD